ncbi:MAG TPA: TRAP transporter small permease subunit [Burkholderiales bacterium]|nr:TRAP transporter small permease subunit [Burkholderiales bacterium]
MEKAYAIWRAFQDQVLGRIAAVLLVGCTLLALVEIFRRYVLGFSYEWQGDAVTFFILSAVFLYFGISQRHNEHLTVTIVVETLDSVGPRAKRAAEAIRLFASTVAFVYLLALAWWGLPEVHDSINYESRTESLSFPMWPFLATLVAGFTFMAVTLFFQIYRAIQALRGVTVLEEPREETPVLE